MKLHNLLITGKNEL